MRRVRYVMLVALAGVAVAGAACSERTADDRFDGAVESTRDGADRLLDGAREGAETAVDKTREVAATTGEAITDAWITTTVNAKFVGETLLENSDINVDTADHVVTLTGRVTSAAAKERAAAIARDTEGVTRVVNQLVVG